MLTNTIKKTRIILADDHKLIRAGLKLLIESKPQYQVVAEADDGGELLSKLASVPCDVVIMDLAMPLVNGFEALQKIRENFPKVKPVVLTSHSDRAFVKKAFSRGAKGYVLKEDATTRLMRAIDEVLEGRKYLCPELTSMMLDEISLDVEKSVAAELLTKKEKEVLRLTAQGLSCKEIGAQMGVSHRTIETHRLNMKEKLRIRTISQLIRFAIDNDLN